MIIIMMSDKLSSWQMSTLWKKKSFCFQSVIKIHKVIRDIDLIVVFYACLFMSVIDCSQFFMFMLLTALIVHNFFCFMIFNFIILFCDDLSFVDWCSFHVEVFDTSDKLLKTKIWVSQKATRSKTTLTIFQSFSISIETEMKLMSYLISKTLNTFANDWRILSCFEYNLFVNCFSFFMYVVIFDKRLIVCVIALSVIAKFLMRRSSRIKISFLSLLFMISWLTCCVKISIRIFVFFNSSSMKTVFKTSDRWRRKKFCVFFWFSSRFLSSNVRKLRLIESELSSFLNSNFLMYDNLIRRSDSSLLKKKKNARLLLFVSLLIRRLLMNFLLLVSLSIRLYLNNTSFSKKNSQMYRDVYETTSQFFF